MRSRWPRWPDRLDPAQFPEDEFPVYCMQCGYELRGLAESRCPECGEPFDRGRLLVLQYLKQRRPRSERLHRLGRIAFWTALTVYFGSVVTSAVLLEVAHWRLKAADPDFTVIELLLMGVLTASFVLRFIALLLFWAGLLLSWFGIPRPVRRKLKMVRERVKEERRRRANEGTS